MCAWIDFVAIAPTFRRYDVIIVWVHIYIVTLITYSTKKNQKKSENQQHENDIHKVTMFVCASVYIVEFLLLFRL